MWKWRNQKELILRVNKRPLSFGITLKKKVEKRHSCLEQVRQMAPWVQNMPLTTTDLAVHKSIQRVQESINIGSRENLEKHCDQIEKMIDHQLFTKLDHLSYTYRSEQG